MSTFKNKNSLRTIEAQIVQKLKRTRPKFTGSYKKKQRVVTVTRQFGTVEYTSSFIADKKSASMGWISTSQDQIGSCRGEILNMFDFQTVLTDPVG